MTGLWLWLLRAIRRTTARTRTTPSASRTVSTDTLVIISLSGTAFRVWMEESVAAR
ncbi:hypothetical protein [Streptomyces luteocolor]|uniref:hypothetical protein n=1 Tax=Streptomyces luteocolor TaxID=285500 RepID=UPI00130139A8|nr:hypothetical protein [Streptomyces luteocolor]